jgi:hypothetical protein
LFQGAIFKITAQRANQVLTFTDYYAIRVVTGLWIRGRVRAAHNHRLSKRVRATKNFVKRRLLNLHGTNKYNISPSEVFIPQRLDTHVQQPDRPIAWQEGGHGKQPKWRQ